MSRLNRSRKLFYFAGVTVSGGHVIIRGPNFDHAKVTPTVPYRMVDVGKLKMATTLCYIVSLASFALAALQQG